MCRAVCFAYLFTSGLAYAMILANIATVMETISSDERELDDRMKSARKFATLHNLSKRQLDSMLDYLLFTHTATHGINAEEVRGTSSTNY